DLLRLWRADTNASCGGSGVAPVVCAAGADTSPAPLFVSAWGRTGAHDSTPPRRESPGSCAESALRVRANPAKGSCPLPPFVRGKTDGSRTWRRARRVSGPHVDDIDGSSLPTPKLPAHISPDHSEVCRARPALGWGAPCSCRNAVPFSARWRHYYHLRVGTPSKLLRPLYPLPTCDVAPRDL